MRSWLLGEKTFEGLPLLLRRPANLDVTLLRPRFPSLVVVTHKFTICQSDGLPESDYNDGLADMDHELITAFDSDHIGVPVLIETSMLSFRQSLVVTKTNNCHGQFMQTPTGALLRAMPVINLAQTSDLNPPSHPWTNPPSAAPAPSARP
jgi:hypothetical protein